MNFSMNTRSSPKLAFASERARVKPSATSALVAGDPHALAAAAGRGLDHHRIADLVGDLQRVLLVLDGAEEAGNGRDLGFGREFLGFDLVAHGRDRRRVRPDERDPGRSQRLGEGRALREKSVARMNGFGSGRLAGGDDLLDHQIGLRRRRRADADRLVGHGDVQRVLVGVGIDRDRADAHAPRGLHHAARDLAAIGDQNLAKHAPAYALHGPGLRRGPGLVNCARRYWTVTRTRTVEQPDRPPPPPHTVKAKASLPVKPALGW